MLSSVTPVEWILGGVVGIGLLVLILLITAPSPTCSRKRADKSWV